MATEKFLFEIGTEELPPKTLGFLSFNLNIEVTEQFTNLQIEYTDFKSYSTPRRLAVTATLEAKQKDQVVEKLGPPISISFDDKGKPTKVAEGFANGFGCSVDDLLRTGEGKNERLLYKGNIAGKETKSFLPSIIEAAIAKLPIAKRMRWGSGDAEFVRPVHWYILLFGDQVVESKLFNLPADRFTLGHRFHHPDKIAIQNPSEYVERLYDAKVIVNFERRMEIINDKAQQAATAVGGTAHIEDDLLEEIAALNEWPVPVTGSFDPRFLELPAEVLITTMQTNQKYFPVKNASGGLLPYFITFSNIESTNPDSIKQGNERVITPRLTDAEFFWKQDRKQPLAARVESLSNIVFQNKLGTLAEKNQRVVDLAETIAKQLNGNVEAAKRAAFLAKADLLTNMVNEFDNLQGLMGRYYALADGEPMEVAQAIEQHYYPKQSGGMLPETTTGQVVALADKVDTLCGIFSAGLIPTGDKDPYGLRRAALGVLRILIEKELSLDVLNLVDTALAQYQHSFDRAETRKLVVDFIFDRLKGYSLDKGFVPDEFDAVMSVNPSQPLDFMKRLQAVKAFRQLPEAESLAAANKRIRNILKKSDTAPAAQVGELVEAEERQLFAIAKQAAADIQPFLERKDYQSVLSRLAQTEPAVNAFFDKAMVMCDDLDLRAQRLALLNLLSDQFLQVADISKLQS